MCPLDDQNKNLILATVLSFLVILVWYTVFSPPPAPDLGAQLPGTSQTAGTTAAPAGTATGTATTTITGTAATGTATGTDDSTAAAAALTTAPRILIDTPRLAGSISLLGGRIDDISLKDYRVKLDKSSPAVRLLAPEGAVADASDKPYFALYGWAAGAGLDAKLAPGATTLWSLAAGDSLAPGKPVELLWDNGAGLIFHRRIEVDDDFIFTVTQSVENRTAAPVRLSSYGVIARRGLPKLEGFYIAHEGAIRISDGKLEELNYNANPGPVISKEKLAFGPVWKYVSWIRRQPAASSASASTSLTPRRSLGSSVMIGAPSMISEPPFSVRKKRYFPGVVTFSQPS